MVKILVLGDNIVDRYSFCKATRLCPEAPAPVLVEEDSRTSEGGAGLVAANLRSLMGDQRCVEFLAGSTSIKYRIFAERTLLARIDKDKFQSQGEKVYTEQINATLTSGTPDAVVVGDYGKGAMSYNIAQYLTKTCCRINVPLFVDAKADPKPYEGCFAIFPNENEHSDLDRKNYQHIIRKLGPKGCSVDGLLVETEEQHVYDVTGAGDVFLAAFVVKYLRKSSLMECAEYANKAAGISVRHLGTYIVRPEELM